MAPSFMIVGRCCLSIVAWIGGKTGWPIWYWRLCLFGDYDVRTNHAPICKNKIKKIY